MIEKTRNRIRKWVRDFWNWLFVLSARHVSLQDRVDLLDREWWNVVRFRLRELGDSDLGQGFARVILMSDEDNAPDLQGRDFRDEDRDVRDNR